MRPIAEIQFADFIAPAMNQIIEEAARFCYRTAGDFSLPLVIRAPWGGGVHGALYHSQSIEATFAHIPGLKVVAPGTPADAKGLLKAAVRDPDPVLFLEHKRTYRLVKGEVPGGDAVVPIGKAEVKREGTDLSLIAYGLMLTYCLEVAEKLAAEDISAEVLDLRTIKPIDQAAIVATAKKTGKVLVVHEDTRFAGIAAEVITDKVNAEVPAPLAGVLKEIKVQEGATVTVGTEIAVIEESVAATPAPGRASAQPPSASAERQAPRESPSPGEDRGRASDEG